MDKYGLFISKEGHNALITPDIHLAFSSEYKTFKVIQTGTIEYSGNDIFDIVHGLGYNPGFMIFYDESVNGVRVMGDIFAVDEVENILTSSYTEDQNTLHIDIGGAGFSGTIRYFIFADTGE